MHTCSLLASAALIFSSRRAACCLGVCFNGSSFKKRKHYLIESKAKRCVKVFTCNRPGGGLFILPLFLFSSKEITNASGSISLNFLILFLFNLEK